MKNRTKYSLSCKETQVLERFRPETTVSIMSICCVMVLLKNHGVWGAYWVEKFPSENESLHICSWNNYIKNRMLSSSFLYTWKLLVNWRANWNPKRSLTKSTFPALRLTYLIKSQLMAIAYIWLLNFHSMSKFFCFTFYYWTSLPLAETINIERFSLTLGCSQVELSEFTTQCLRQHQWHKRSFPDL